MNRNPRVEINSFDIPNPMAAARPSRRRVYDFHLCEGIGKLKITLAEINEQGYELVSVTQYINTYTVFFRRPV